MDKDRCRDICQEVFDSWALIFEEHNSTPLLAIGIAHGARSRQLHLCVRDDPALTPEVIRAFLIAAAGLVK